MSWLLNVCLISVNFGLHYLDCFQVRVNKIKKKVCPGPENNVMLDTQDWPVATNTNQCKTRRRFEVMGDLAQCIQLVFL